LATGEKRKRVLIMDDEDMVGEIAIQMLDYLGFDAVHVKDGVTAIDTYREQKENGEGFDCVIMDLSIPGGMGGEDAVSEILAIDQDAKVLVSSGYSTDPVMINYKDYGFSGVMAKPFDLQDMKKSLESI